MNMESLQLDQIIEGVVKNVTNFGAFVDIGLKESGLVHISELSNTFVTDPFEIVKPGDRVKVKIISLDTGEFFVRMQCLIWPQQQWVIDQELVPRIRATMRSERLEVPNDKIVVFYHHREKRSVSPRRPDKAEKSRLK